VTSTTTDPGAEQAWKDATIFPAFSPARPAPWVLDPMTSIPGCHPGATSTE
jgi:hypothetical protein